MFLNQSWRWVVPQDPAQDSAQEPRENLSFEQILARLSQVVERLEAGEIPLEQALSSFEQGVSLSRLGAQRLDEAERRIELLLRDEKGLVLRPLAQEPDDE
jgi:exodeoxyribonuclease VII small subunit